MPFNWCIRLREFKIIIPVNDPFIFNGDLGEIPECALSLPAWKRNEIKRHSQRMRTNVISL
ncbi:MAG: hypothetical protein ACTSUE_22690 [Promethearchaeota archaeon]